MGKRVIIFLCVCILTLSNRNFSIVQAADIKSPYLAEQAIAKAPVVKVYLSGSQMKDSAVVSGKADKINLVQSENAVTFEESNEGINYIILLDNSGSVNEAQFEEAKKELVKMRKTLQDKDRMNLYTVGTNSAAGEKKAIFEREDKISEKKNSDCKKIKQIEYMSSPDSKTVLYRSLNQVLAEQTSPDMRTIVLMITDGEDDSKGKDIDKVSTVQEVKEATVPVYGILLNRNGGGEDRKMSYTRNKILAEKNCRGYYHDCSVNSSTKSVKEAFQTIDELLKKETYVVTLKASTNKTIGKTKLKLTVDNSAVNTISMDYSDYEADKNAPSVTGDIKKTGKNSITFSIEDNNGVNLTDVKDKSHYIVQRKKKDKDGKIWEIQSVNAVSDGNSVSVTLTFKDELYKTDYVLKCNDIRDESQDANTMALETEFTVKEGSGAIIFSIKNAIKSYWWIGLILLVIVIGILILKTVKKKAIKIVEANPEELSQADKKIIRLTITDRSGAIKDVEWNVEGSLFVGRSNICNIYFDDDRLSKQHFVIEVNKMGCYIEDLESTNGTFVNGVKITNRRMLLDGDIITVGREKIVFHVPKNQPLTGLKEDVQE